MASGRRVMGKWTSVLGGPADGRVREPTRGGYSCAS